MSCASEHYSVCHILFLSFYNFFLLSLCACVFVHMISEWFLFYTVWNICLDRRTGCNSGPLGTRKWGNIFFYLSFSAGRVMNGGWKILSDAYCQRQTTTDHFPAGNYNWEILCCKRWGFEEVPRSLEATPTAEQKVRAVTSSCVSGKNFLIHIYLFLLELTTGPSSTSMTC